jgi:hypothetical protein
MAVYAIAASMPPVGHLVGLRPQGFTEFSGSSAAVDHPFDVPQQMGPTELPSPAGIPGICAPAIGNQLAPIALPQESWSDIATT